MAQIGLEAVIEPEALALKNRIWIGRSELSLLSSPVLHSLQLVLARQLSLVTEVGVSSAAAAAPFLHGLTKRSAGLGV